jgi:hypothetical protein
MTYDDAHQITFPPGTYHGLGDALAAAGLALENNNGNWYANDPQAVLAFIASYDPLPAQRKALWASVADDRIRRQQLGVPYTFPDGQAGTIQTRNEQDLLNINGLATRALMAQAAGVTDPVFGFRDEENRSHSMTPAQVLDLAVAASNFVEALYTAKWAHDSAIAAWDGSSQYDLGAYWPE